MPAGAAAAGLLWLGVFALATALVRPGLPTKLLGDVVYLLPILLATVLAARAARGPSRRHRAFWWLLAGSNALWLAGELIWGVYELVLDRGAPFPSAADVFYLSSYALVVPAVLRGFAPTIRERSWRGLLDASIMVVAIGFAGWSLLIGPQLEYGFSLATATGISYPLLGVAILMLLGAFAYGAHRHLPASVALVALAFGVSALTDAGYTYLAVLHEYVPGRWLNIGWEAEAVLLCLAALTAIRREDGDDEAGGVGRDLGLPLVLVGASGALAIVAVDGFNGALGVGSAAVGAYTILAVVARLLVTSRERERFARRLEHSLVEQATLVTTLEQRSERLTEQAQALAASLEAHDQAERQRKRLEQQLLQSQKMEAVGRIAGGIAHDFNNLLTAISGYATMLVERLEPPADREAKEIKHASERAAALTRELLAFSSKQMMQPRVVDLNDIVRGSDELLRRLLADNVELELSLADDLPAVLVDRAQMEQVIVNLVLNARDAMPDGGCAALATSTADLFSDSARSGLDLPGGRYVSLSLRDNGCGMNPDTRLHAFEPFFTTKPVGGGSGLGLSTTYGIVRQSGGDVRIESHPGAGTTVEVLIPLAPVGADGDVVASGMPAEPVSETVLLVEDEEVVRNLLTELLESAGYRVIAASGGDQGLEAAAAHGGELDVLLTDVVMPGIGGRELAERLSSVRPSIAVVFMSGYTDDAVMRHGVPGDVANFLQKPFSKDELLGAIRAALAERIV